MAGAILRRILLPTQTLGSISVGGLQLPKWEYNKVLALDIPAGV